MRTAISDRLSKYRQLYKLEKSRGISFNTKINSEAMFRTTYDEKQQQWHGLEKRSLINPQATLGEFLLKIYAKLWTQNSAGELVHNIQYNRW